MRSCPASVDWAWALMRIVEARAKLWDCSPDHRAAW